MVKYSRKSILWSYSNAVRSNLVSVHHQECDNFKRWKKKYVEEQNTVTESMIGIQTIHA